MLRLITSVTLASGGATAAFLAMGVAAADPDATTVTVPDPFGVTFVAPRMATGFSSDYIELVEPGNHDAIGEWLVTPMGTYDDVSASAGAEAAMFDPSYFDPAAVFPVDSLAPPFNFLF